MKDWLQTGMRVHFGVMEVLQAWIVGILAQRYKYTKSDQIYA